MSNDGGLVVPILHGIEKKPLEALQSDWTRAGRARAGKEIGPAEYSNPTFTISNMACWACRTHRDPHPRHFRDSGDCRQRTAGHAFTIYWRPPRAERCRRALYLTTLKQTIEAPESWLGAGGAAAEAVVGAAATTSAPVSPIPEGNWDFPVVVVGGGPAARTARATWPITHQSHDGQQRALPPRRMPVARLHPVQGLARRSGRHPQPCARC